MAISSKIIGVGHYVPEQVIKNTDLEKIMDTSHEWIVERTGIEERRFGKRHEETTTTMAKVAAERALADAGIEASEIDFIVFATLSPDYYFPGCGVLLQRELGIAGTEIAALDIRNQCSGFVYGISIVDQFIKAGQHKTILLVGAEMHSMGMDFSTKGRGVSVIFGDGAGAVVVRAQEKSDSGILATSLHSDGRHAEELAFISPGSHSGRTPEDVDYGFSDNPFDSVFVTKKMLDDDMLYPYMNGQLVFKHAVRKFPEVIIETAKKANVNIADLGILIPHQANLRISQFVQRTLKLRDDQVFNNIMKYGNTTAASIPIALSEAKQAGRINDGDLVCLAAFGSGFTWGAAMIKW